MFTFVSLLSAIFPAFSFKKAFSSPLPIAQRFSQHYLAICEFLVAIRAACRIHLSVLLNLVVIFLSVPCHTWDFGGPAILQGKFFSCSLLPVCNSGLPKVLLSEVTLPCSQVEGAHVMGRGRIKGQKSNFHAQSCYQSNTLAVSTIS